MTPPPQAETRTKPRADVPVEAAASATAAAESTVDRDRAATTADNVAYFRGQPDDKTPADSGKRHAAAPDRHQLPPSAVRTPAQFEMSYGTPAADDGGMSSKENLLTPRGQ